MNLASVMRRTVSRPAGRQSLVCVASRGYDGRPVELTAAVFVTASTRETHGRQ